MIRPIVLAAAITAVSLATAVVSATAGPRTQLTPLQVAHMSNCLDDQEKGADLGRCAEFMPPQRVGTNVKLTETQANRMAECVDQQTGQGTRGAPDTCAEFVHARKGRR